MNADDYALSRVQTVDSTQPGNPPSPGPVSAADPSLIQPSRCWLRNSIVQFIAQQDKVQGFMKNMVDNSPIDLFSQMMKKNISTWNAKQKDKKDKKDKKNK
ncbi:MAG: hypothetical protein V7682_07525 [Cycloclasticus sp.]